MEPVLVLKGTIEQGFPKGFLGFLEPILGVQKLMFHNTGQKMLKGTLFSKSLLSHEVLLKVVKVVLRSKISGSQGLPSEQQYLLT